MSSEAAGAVPKNRGNSQGSAVTGMVAQEIRTLRTNLGREVRKELREAVGQIASARTVVPEEDR